MTNKATKYGLMTIAAVLLVAMAFAGAASAEVTVVTTEAELQDALNQTSADIRLGSNIDLENCLVFGDGSTENTSTLDLNGFVLYQTTDHTRVLKIMKNATLRLTDSNPSTVHVFAFNRSGAWDYKPDETTGISIDEITDSTADGTLVIVPGGVITSVSRTLVGGVDVGTRGGGAVLVTGKLVMDSGTFAGCADTSSSLGRGGAILVGDGVTSSSWGDAGSLVMDGTAQIVGCAGRLGGAIVVDSGTFTMSGGTITGCSASICGGGVYSNSNFVMSGGKIVNCKVISSAIYPDDGGGAIQNQAIMHITGNAIIENCYTNCNGGAIASTSKAQTYIEGGTFRNNTADLRGGAIAVGNNKCWVSGGTFENNKGTYGGAINVGYSNPYFIITGGIFRDNHDSTGSNAITTEKRSGTQLPNIIIGGDVILEDDQSFRLIDLPSGTGSFKIGTPTDITGASFTDEKFTGLIKNFIIDNDNLDGRTLFEIKSGQGATDVLGRLGLNDTAKWTLVANETSDPKKITIKLNRPVASSASVLFSEDNTTAYVNITLTDDNDAATAVVEFWNASGKINSSNVVTDGLTKGRTVGGFVVEGLVENYEYTVTANLTMVDSEVIYANYTLGTFNCSNPKITTHPQSAVYKLGEEATALEVGTEAVGATYQWENSTDGKTFTEMIGEKYDNITPSTDAIGTVYYRVNVTAADKSVYSLAAAVEVYDTYSITYNNPQSGSSGNPTTYSSNETITLNDPVMPYYVGAWVDRISGNMVSVIYKGTTGDLILDAQYTAREYYIMYIDGGTTTNPASYNVKSGTIYLTDATRNGYKFIGWYDNAAFTGEKVTSISSAAPKDTILYARWVEQVTKTVDSEGNATFNGDERIAIARIAGTQTLLSEVSGLTTGQHITFVKDIPELSASDLPVKSGYYTNLYSAFEINYDDTLSGEAQITLKVTLANGDSADSLHALHQGSSGWEYLTDVSKTQSGNEVTIVGNVSSFSPFAVVSYSAQPQQYTPSSSHSTGSTQILSEGQTAPTAYATAAPTVAPTVKPTEKPATPTVIATAAPTTQATQQSPAPVVGLLAGLGAAAVLLRLRK